MMSTNPDRGVAHLEAFVNYAEHAQEQALYRAHTATEAAAQRTAIADWVYWQHLSVLISDALAGSAANDTDTDALSCYEWGFPKSSG